MEEIENSGMAKFNDAAIIITELGASYYINAKSWVIQSEKPIIVIFDNKGTKISLLVLIAWLKSSLLLFSVLQQYGSSNIFAANVFRGIVTPIFTEEDAEIVELLENLVGEILRVEREFLVNYRRLDTINDVTSDSVDLSANQDKLIESHNKQINGIALEIDKAFFEFFSLSEDQIDCVYETIQASNIFDLRKNV